MSGFVDAHARDVDRADEYFERCHPELETPPARVIAIDLNQVPTAIAESVYAVLKQRGLLGVLQAADPDFATLFAEIGNNAAQGVAFCEPLDEQEAA